MLTCCLYSILVQFVIVSIKIYKPMAKSVHSVAVVYVLLFYLSKIRKEREFGFSLLLFVISTIL